MMTSSVVRHVGSLALVLAVLVCGPEARAQQPTASALNSAREILDLKQANLIYEAVIPQIIEQARNLFLQTNPMLSKDLTEVAAQLRKDLTPRQKELADEMIKAYASRFTEQELKELANFYKSPLGRKVNLEEPKLLEQLASTIVTWRERLSEEILDKFRAEMKKKGHNL